MALSKFLLLSIPEKKQGLPSISTYVVIVVAITSALTTTVTSAKSQTCDDHHPDNNIQIFTGTESSTELTGVKQQLTEVINLLNGTRTAPVDENRPRDCSDIRRAGVNMNGQHKVYPDDGGDPFFVFCDMDTDGGGWTVFQRRQDDTVDFYRNWQSYKNGFGSVYGDHWLGNDRIHRLTSQKSYALRVDLWDWQGQTVFAHYSRFSIAGEDNDYKLTVGGYSGTAGTRDSMAQHNGKRFSTYDRDNDVSNNGHCSQNYHGAWWYGNCYDAHTTGRVYGKEDSNADHAEGIVWEFWTGNYHPLKKAEMKIRPV